MSDDRMCIKSMAVGYDEDIVVYVVGYERTDLMSVYAEKLRSDQLHIIRTLKKRSSRLKDRNGRLNRENEKRSKRRGVKK